MSDVRVSPGTARCCLSTACSSAPGMEDLKGKFKNLFGKVSNQVNRATQGTFQGPGRRLGTAEVGRQQSCFGLSTVLHMSAALPATVPANGPWEGWTAEPFGIMTHDLCNSAAYQAECSTHTHDTPAYMALAPSQLECIASMPYNFLSEAPELR